MARKTLRGLFYCGLAACGCAWRDFGVLYSLDNFCGKTLCKITIDFFLKIIYNIYRKSKGADIMKRYKLWYVKTMRKDGTFDIDMTWLKDTEQAENYKVFYLVDVIDRVVLIDNRESIKAEAKRVLMVG